MAVYKKELTSDKVTNTLSMFVERHSNAVQIRLMAVIKKEQIKKVFVKMLTIRRN